MNALNSLKQFGCFCSLVKGDIDKNEVQNYIGISLLRRFNIVYQFFALTQLVSLHQRVSLDCVEERMLVAFLKFYENKE
jgi:hypothetical protein